MRGLDVALGLLRTLTLGAVAETQETRGRAAIAQLASVPAEERQRRLARIGVLAADALTMDSALPDREARDVMRRALRSIVTIAEGGDEFAALPAAAAPR